VAVLVQGYERVSTGMTLVIIVSFVIVDIESETVEREVVRDVTWVVPHKVAGGRISHMVTTSLCFQFRSINTTVGLDHHHGI
jgi:hypothetical protein